MLLHKPPTVTRYETFSSEMTEAMVRKNYIASLVSQRLRVVGKALVEIQPNLFGCLPTIITIRARVVPEAGFYD